MPSSWARWAVLSGTLARRKRVPEYGLLRLRKELRLYANLRPVKAIAALVDSSPLKREIVEGTDLLVLRELTGGLYFGRPRGRSTNKQGIRVKDTLTYTSGEMERIIRLGFDLARQSPQATGLGG